MDHSSERPESKHQGAVLVTGAGSGIGAATARRLNEHGYLVFAGVRQAHHGPELKSSVSNSANLLPLTMDVTDEGAIRRAAESVRQRLAERSEQLVGLVNNAADENLGPVEVLPLEVFRREIEVGYLGMVAVTKAFLPLLREGTGRIVNISSVNGRCAFKYHSTTCATKYAVEAFSDALRMELKPWGMHVAIIEPGPTDTPLMREKTIEEFSEKLARYPPDQLEMYFPDFEETVRGVERFVQRIQAPAKGPWNKLRRLITGDGWLHSPNDVTRVIQHALQSPRPKTRYLIGLQAKLLYRARRLLGDRSFDRWIGEKVFDF